MISNETAKAAEAVSTVVQYQDAHGNDDITRFSVAAHRCLSGGSTLKADRDAASHLSGLMTAMIANEAGLPAGVRLRSFCYSPITALSDVAIPGAKCIPTTPSGLEAWLREATGWDSGFDPLIRKAAGFDLKLMAKAMVALFASDLIAFFHLLNFNFGPHLDACAVMVPAHTDKANKAAKRSCPFFTPVRLATQMQRIAEWQRIAAIVDHLYRHRRLRHVAFRNASNAPKLADRMQRGKCLQAILCAQPLPVPMLAASLFGLNLTDQIAELNRVLMPGLGAANSKQRPLYHFYGLDYVDVLLVGWLSLVCDARGVGLVKSGVRGRHALAKRIGYGDVDLASFAASCASRWPDIVSDVTHDRLQRARALLLNWWNSDALFGSAFAFDPARWRDPECDAALFRKLAEQPSSAMAGPAYDNVVAGVRDQLFALNGTVPSAPDMPLASRAAAHLLTATVPITRDPTLLILQDHQLWTGGHRTKRGPGAAAAVTYPVRIGQARYPWGCVILVRDPRRRIYPELPAKGVGRFVFY